MASALSTKEAQRRGFFLDGGGGIGYIAYIRKELNPSVSSFNAIICSF